MIRKRLRTRRDLHLERMFETHTEAWERVGLAVNVTQRAARRARREAAILIPILIGILVASSLRKQLFGARYDTPVRIGTVIGLMILGWTLARDVGRAAA